MTVEIDERSFFSPVGAVPRYNRLEGSCYLNTLQGAGIKLHEVERIWTPRFGGWGGRLKFYYINLPLPVVEQREWKENKNLSLSIQTNCNLAWQKKGIFYLLFCFFFQKLG